MKWLEADPVPTECTGCKERDCYNCDTAGKRWYLSEEDQLRTTRTLKLQAIRRLQQQVAEIDMQLQRIRQQQDAET